VNRTGCRLVLGFVLAAGATALVRGQRPPAPDLAFISYEAYGAAEFKAAPGVVARLTRARMKMGPAQSRAFLERLFDDRIPGLAYIAAALNLGLPVPAERQQALIAREKTIARHPDETADICERISTLNVQRNELDGYPFFTKGLYRFWVLDLNGDGKADLMLVPRMYYGPSAGLAFYGREGDRFVYLGEHSGEISRIDEGPAMTVLRFRVNILDPSETGVIVNLGFDRRRQSWTLTRQRYAQQTEFPARFSSPVASITARECELRTGPRADDGPPRTDRDDPVATITLKGNIVARVPTGAACDIRGVRGDWAFVAFRPDTRPLETSLGHDLDHSLDRVRAEAGAAPLPTWVCGWVRRDALVASGNR
jgi:hypothetical protein